LRRAPTPRAFGSHGAVPSCSAVARRTTCAGETAPPAAPVHHSRDRPRPQEAGASRPPLHQFGQVLDWYDDRSAIAHGGRAEFPEKEESRATFWLTHRLLPQALDWFANHPDQPLQDLETAIAALPEPPRDANGLYFADANL